MSFGLYIAVLSLIVIAIVLSTYATYFMFTHFTKVQTEKQLALVAEMLEDDDEDIDYRYEQNRQIIDPLADPRN